MKQYAGIVCSSQQTMFGQLMFGQLMFLRLGTGNGMAKSLLDSVGEPCKVSNAVLAIIRGCLWHLTVYYCSISPTLISWLNKFLHVKFIDRA